MTHLKTRAAPTSWPLQRKEVKWVVSPRAGPHKAREAIPLGLVLRDLLHYGTTIREIKKILGNKKILVDKTFRKDHKFPLGIMDIVEVPDTKEIFVILMNKGGKFILMPVKDSHSKLCKIQNKHILKNGRVQLTFHDGKTLFVDKQNYKPGDSIILDLEKNTIKKHLKLEKDASIYLTAGKYQGSTGVLQTIHESQRAPSKITFKIDNHTKETFKKYAFVVDKAVLGDQNESDESTKTE